MVKQDMFSSIEYPHAVPKCIQMRCSPCKYYNENNTSSCTRGSDCFYMYYHGSVKDTHVHEYVVCVEGLPQSMHNNELERLCNHFGHKTVVRQVLHRSVGNKCCTAHVHFVSKQSAIKFIEYCGSNNITGGPLLKYIHSGEIDPHIS